MADTPPTPVEDRVTDERAPSGHRSPLRGMARGWLRVWERIPPRWRYVAGLFLIAKIVLTVTGLVVLYALEPQTELPAGDPRIHTEVERHALGLPRWLSMWFAWDSFNYDHIALEPFADGPQQFAFPLLYPFLSRAVAPLLGGHVALALLVVSNVAFLFLLYHAHRLGEQLLGSEADARRFTRYVVLLPAAFLFQAALTESLFVCLALAAFSSAERGKWLQAGVFGYFAALSRSVGFLLVASLALILLERGRYRLRRTDLVEYANTGWPLLLVPMGWLSFMAYCRWRVGDWFAYSHAQERGWQITGQNPVRTLHEGLTVAAPRDAVRVGFVVVALLLVLVCAWYLKPAYPIYGLMMIAVPLSIGAPGYRSLIRYLVVVFPLSLLFAIWARRPGVDTFLTATLALVQGALFVVWLSYWSLFII